ncbi:hypothetical protein ILP97_56775 [Amycolatopsis sp. H6(2020)]|nr:hypothetical protein [Amycolatopsis sp. H6(2020)]
MSSSSPTPSAADAPRVRPSRTVLLLCALVALEAAALIVVGLIQAVQAFLSPHVMPAGAIVLMGLLYLGYGVWLMAAARGLRAGRLWSRALILLTQVFLILVSIQLIFPSSRLLAVLLGVLGAVILMLLFSSPVQRHLLAGIGGDAEAERD